MLHIDGASSQGGGRWQPAPCAPSVLALPRRRRSARSLLPETRADELTDVTNNRYLIGVTCQRRSVLQSCCIFGSLICAAGLCRTRGQDLSARTRANARGAQELALVFPSSSEVYPPRPAGAGWGQGDTANQPDRNLFLPGIRFRFTPDEFSPLPLSYALCRISSALEHFSSFSYDLFYEALIIIVYYYCVLIAYLGPSEPSSEQFINNTIPVITVICLALFYSPHLPSAPLLFYEAVC